MANNDLSSNNRPEYPWARQVIALSITGVSIVGLLLLAWASISGETRTPPKEILATLLPVIGTWVGTVLAFYFGRENFESANRSVERMVKTMTSSEKLAATPVRGRMIENDPKTLFSKREPFDKVVLPGVISELEASSKGNRVPLFDQTGKLIRGVAHRSLIDRFLSSQALANKSATDLAKLTMEDLLKDPKLRSIVEAFGTVKADATLAEAKQVMDAIRNCQDVFVTKSGDAKDEVIGWITNVIIEDNSRV
jgi:hypothetical protein